MSPFPLAAAQEALPLVSLQSKDHEELLNIIDKLRSQGISRYIDIPQIIVCGDQSSGKSSVLEAVSGLRFPSKDDLCTRFATELVLRRLPVNSSAITIVPDASRPESEKKKLLEFKAAGTIHEDFGAIIESAGLAMGLGPGGKAFSTDILRVEVTGPNLPHLTLVDLPGLFQAGSKTQSDQDAESVKSLVTTCMKKSRSIILAVVSAKSDFNLQIVTRYARDYDVGGDRTLGIITKPDVLDQGSESERHYVDLAQNKDVSFRLGWHVLRNRDYLTRNATAEERDRIEEEFFNQGIWTSLSPGQLGIGSLKPRLSRVLKDQILTELPGLIHDVQSGINECNRKLDRLGGARASLQDQRLYLLKVSQQFSDIIKIALNGMYDGDYFEDPTTKKGYHQRLRAVTQNVLSDFETKMRLRGHYHEIVDGEILPATPDSPPPHDITRDNMLSQIALMIKRTRGRELPGTYKPEIIDTLFQQQARPWRNIVFQVAAEIFDATRTAILLALGHTADDETADGVLRIIINPVLNTIRKKFDAKTLEVLKQHEQGHPITFNHYLTDNIQKARQKQRKKMLASKIEDLWGVDPLSESYIYFPGHKGGINTRAILDALTTDTEADMETFACSEALDCMQAYYKVALKFVIDDFSIHAVEETLLKNIPGIFTPEIVIGLADAVIEDVAAETEESKVERASCLVKKQTLEEALAVLQRLDRHKPRVKAKLEESELSKEEDEEMVEETVEELSDF